MVESEKGFELFSVIPLSVPELEKRKNGLTFDSDGIELLCSVCGAKADGTKDGVYCCIPCKDFCYKKLQQPWILEPPCTNNQQCSNLRINLKSCPVCRLKKCITVGMFKGPRTVQTPKKKTDIPGAMQKVNTGYQEKYHLYYITSLKLNDEAVLVHTIVEAHKDTCDYTKLLGRSQLLKANIPPQTACLLNPAPYMIGTGDPRYFEDFIERFEPAINGVGEFAKRIPGFRLLSPEDQKTLIKAGLFEVLLVRLASKSDYKPNFLMYPGSLRCRSLHFVQSMKALNLSETEFSLVSAAVVMTGRPGLRNMDFVLKIQEKIIIILEKLVTAKHGGNQYFFNNLKKNILFLTTLNEEHSKQLLTYKIEPRNESNRLFWYRLNA